ncbi:unnamed protein product [Didymodactylos carnosus]|uniref:Uncharacterized protein n=1 Tax=Didymodactylos carnosus TaxID=1234261 RepID=A0A814HDU8_9BILA|nr:unnamed protein product [Didymodactylos carnosus]CAF3779465.1 unnamed protein product [Didymodactylos carnosus]
MENIRKNRVINVVVHHQQVLTDQSGEIREFGVTQNSALARILSNGIFRVIIAGAPDSNCGPLCLDHSNNNRNSSDFFYNGTTQQITAGYPFDFYTFLGYELSQILYVVVQPTFIFSEGDGSFDQIELIINNNQAEISDPSWLFRPARIAQLAATCSFIRKDEYIALAGPLSMPGNIPLTNSTTTVDLAAISGLVIAVACAGGSQDITAKKLFTIATIIYYCENSAQMYEDVANGENASVVFVTVQGEVATFGLVQRNGQNRSGLRVLPNTVTPFDTIGGSVCLYSKR